jgi:PleD family two-component response regulator
LAIEWLSAPSHIDRNSSSRSHRDTTDNDNNLHYSQTIDNNSSLQNQSVNNNTFSILKPFYKRILIVDDNTDITLTFKSALEGSYDDKRFEVYAYNNPLVALSEFKPHFHDLLLTDINMPEMNGFQLCGLLKHLLL